MNLQESNILSKSYFKPQMFIGQVATKEIILAEMKNCVIFHVAAHASLETADIAGVLSGKII